MNIEPSSPRFSAEMKHPGSSKSINLAHIWEQIYPLAFGMVGVICCVVWGPDLQKLSDEKNWHLDQLFTAAFGYISITTGFLATFYGTIQSMSSGFVHRIRDTNTYKYTTSMTKSAHQTASKINVVSGNVY
jgi:hypothetical protein